MKNRYVTGLGSTPAVRWTWMPGTGARFIFLLRKVYATLRGS